MFGSRVRPDISAHTPGARKGEEEVERSGREPGREDINRTARDATSVNADARGPIDPRMPHMPPA